VAAVAVVARMMAAVAHRRCKMLPRILLLRRLSKLLRRKRRRNSLIRIVVCMASITRPLQSVSATTLGSRTKRRNRVEGSTAPSMRKERVNVMGMVFACLVNAIVWLVSVCRTAQLTSAMTKSACSNVEPTANAQTVIASVSRVGKERGVMSRSV